MTADRRHYPDHPDHDFGPIELTAWEKVGIALIYAACAGVSLFAIVQSMLVIVRALT